MLPANFWKYVAVILASSWTLVVTEDQVVRQCVKFRRVSLRVHFHLSETGRINRVSSILDIAHD